MMARAVPSLPVAQRVRRTRVQQRAFHDQAVRAALEMFEASDDETLSMRRLAREVGVPLMSLYRYFPSKMHLMRYVWVDLLLRAHRHALDAQRSGDGNMERLRRYLDAWLQYWLDHPRHYWIVFAIHDSGHGCSDGSDGEWPRPDPWRFIAVLDELIDSDPGRSCGGTRRGPPHRIESLFCSTLGFLTGVICTRTLDRVDVGALKRDFIAGLIGSLAIA